MSEQLFIRLAENAHSPIQWGIKNNEQSAFMQQGTLESVAQLDEISTLCHSRRVIVLVPSSKIYYTLADFPSKQARHISRALPFALEEQLADDIQTLHFATQKHLENGLLPVAVVRHPLMQQWLGYFADADIEPYALVPECLLMTHQANQWTLYLDDDQLIFCDDAQHVLYGDRELGQHALQQHLSALQQADNVGAIACEIHCPSPAVAASVEPLLPEAVDVTHVPFDDAFYHLASHYQAGMMNLLQGSYSRSDKWMKLLQHWKVAASLAAVYLLASLISAGFEVRSLKQQETAFKQQQIELYKQAFPDTRRFNNLSTRMKGKLNELKRSGGGSSFIALMEQVGSVFTETQSIRPIGIFYDQKRQEMRLTLSGKSFQSFETIQQKLSAMQLTAKLGSASKGKDGSFSGSVTIEIN